jgi:radical SAM superfamily enzyme YgiQ (UPF0313 family)
VIAIPSSSGLVKRPLRIGLVQINNGFSGQSYLPYSVALIQSYLQAHARAAAHLEFLDPIFSRVKVPEAAEQLEDADLILFSTYVWNIRISLEIARMVKIKSPSTRLVFGGPQVPDQSKEFLEKHPYIDVAVHGEGEQVMTSLTDAFFEDSASWKNVPGISYLDEKKGFCTNPKGPRLKDINTVPSPFLNGVFNRLIDKQPGMKWIALWETNRGCPFSCTFCDWGSSTQSRVFQFQLERLYKEAHWFADHEIEFVFCCDANFGILPRDLEIARFLADLRSSRKFPRAVSVQNTKNATERAYEVQKVLSDAGLNKGVTLSMQSLDRLTLKNIKRENISLESYQELQRRFTRDKVETYTDLILGLPGETYASFLNGISTVIENGQHNRIQFNNLSILPNAEMGDPGYQRQHGMITVESDIINIHGSLSDAEHEIFEKQQLVIATASMPHREWVRTRAICWMTALLYFDKVLQIPLLAVQQLTGLRFSDLFENLMERKTADIPVLNEVRRFFLDKAVDIQKGGPEYCLSKEHLGIFWPADEYILIQLLAGDKIQAFYADCKKVLEETMGESSKSLGPILEEAVRLNEALLKKPFQSEDLTLELEYNLWSYYRGLLIGEEVPLENVPVKFRIDRTSAVWHSWDDFCREVIWYGNKKGAYLYTECKVEPQIAGIY